MTYCLAINTENGLVFCSDSRTNAGVDQVSTYSKMYRFGVEGERQFMVLSAGNLATTQAVVSRLKKDVKEEAEVSLLTVESMSDAAEYLGEVNRAQQEKHSDNNGSKGFEASFIIGGQVRGDKPRVMMVYPAGNHITTSKDTRYLQIGESKYGKPILDRILTAKTDLHTAALCALVSMDSTMRSNLTVGPPIELIIYEKDSFSIQHNRFDEDDEYLRELKKAWDARLVEAFVKLPPIVWQPQSLDESNEV
ncbi:peptidase [Marinimicrobium sp. C2-29]|uniref:peptidase n=1 Tax=Marinimicrobium sp. C2-29 TaxID=3139825 RepID=UPI0031394E15